MILIFPSPNFRILKFEDLAVMRKTIGNVDSSHWNSVWLATKWWQFKKLMANIDIPLDGKHIKWSRPIR